MQDFGQSVEMRGGSHFIVGIGDHLCTAQVINTCMKMSSAIFALHAEVVS